MGGWFYCKCFIPGKQKRGRGNFCAAKTCSSWVLLGLVLCRAGTLWSLCVPSSSVHPGTCQWLLTTGTLLLCEVHSVCKKSKSSHCLLCFPFIFLTLHLRFALSPLTGLKKALNVVPAQEQWEKIRKVPPRSNKYYYLLLFIWISTPENLS